MSGSLTGIVLAGGAGRRLGADKATLPFGGRQLVDLVIERLSVVCDEVIVACGSSQRRLIAEQNARAVADWRPGEGPLAGLQAGLRAAANPVTLLVACDMPFLNPALLSYLAHVSDGVEAAVPFLGGHPHPLHAAYSRDVLPVVDMLLERGERRMKALLARINVRPVEELEARLFDRGLLSVFNVNRPEDLRRARVLWEQDAVEVAA
jgi:molybdopterin-guanine dinucleotide biosynthesis protein A